MPADPAGGSDESRSLQGRARELRDRFAVIDGATAGDQVAADRLGLARGTGDSACVVVWPDALHEVEGSNRPSAVVVDPDALDQLASITAQLTTAGHRVDLEAVGGSVVVWAAPASASGHAPVEGSAHLHEVLAAAARQLAARNAELEADVARRADELTQMAKSAQALHERSAETAESRHRAEVRSVLESSRYVLGDVVIGGLRAPGTLRTAPKRLRRIYANRVKHDAVPQRPDLPTPPRTAVRVGAILDEFSWDCFAPEADLVELDPKRLDVQVDPDLLDLVFVESAWRGNRGKWNYAINKFASRDPNRLEELLARAEALGIPAVFWNKEDPVNYDEFITAASRFPAILTTDAEVVSRYVTDVGHDRVRPLPFAAQTRLHNPIGSKTDVAPKVCFAGAWRGEKYAQRSDDFRILLDPALELGALDIFDRYADHKDAAKLGFPEPYRSAVRGSLPYPEMVKAYRSYAAFLNVNSVTESPTMFSRRVFEVLACATPVISTPSAGIDNLLGEHVITVRTPDETMDAVRSMIWDVDERERRGHLGYRFVHTKHTYTERFAEVADIAGLGVPSRTERPVTVVCVSNRPENLEHVIDAYRRQTYESRELVFVGNSDAFDRDRVDAVLASIDGARAIFVPESATLADGLNAALEIAGGRYVAKFDDDDDYGDHYLSDMMLTFEYSSCGVAGKRSYYAYLHGKDRTVLRFPGREFQEVPAVIGGTIVFDREAVGRIAFTPVQRGTDSIFLDECRTAGIGVFSADRYNFVQHRHLDLGRHTWKIDEDEFLRASVDVGPGYERSAVFV